MSEVATPETPLRADEQDHSSAASTPVSNLSFGAQLTNAREQQGISLLDMAARLRLHPKQVAALENEQLTALPEAPFVRGFLRNYAKELGLNPEPLLQSLAERYLPSAATPSRASSTPPAIDAVANGGVTRQIVIALVIGALLVLGVIGWSATRQPQTPLSAAGPEQTAPVPASVAAVTADAANAATPASADAADANEVTTEPAGASPSDATASAALENSAAAVNTAPATAATAAATSTVKDGKDLVPPSADVASTPAAVTAAGSSTATATTAPTATTSGANVLRLSFGNRPSWVEVTQADGRVLWSGMNAADSERRVVGRPPFNVVIGNASSVTLEYRGRAVDLKRYIRGDDLARLTLE